MFRTTISPLTIFLMGLAFTCAPAPKPTPSTTGEASRNSGTTSPTPSPSGGAVNPKVLYGADAGDQASREAVHKCLQSNLAPDRRNKNNCLPDGSPKVNSKYRSFADLENDQNFPKQTLTALVEWMAKPEKGFEKRHLDFVLTCKAGAPANILCKDAVGNVLNNATVFAFAKDTKDGIAFSSAITNSLFE